MNHTPQAWGRPRDDVYGPYDASYLRPSSEINQHTQSPIVTGTSVIAVKFRDGVVIAADNLASYGSLARFRDVERLIPFANKAIVGVGGDVSDMQYLTRFLTSLEIREAQGHHRFQGAKTEGGKKADDNNNNNDDNAVRLTAQNLHTYLGKVFYKRRSDFNPLWNQVLVAGFDGDDKPFLSSVDLLGTTFSGPTLATGFGAHLAQPILRRLIEDDADVERIDYDTALAAVRQCMNVLFYRDARSLDSYSIGVISKDTGVNVKPGQRLQNQSWAFAEGIRGYGTQVN